MTERHRTPLLQAYKKMLLCVGVDTNVGVIVLFIAIVL